ncbi:tetraspanin-7-like [Platysternon megacephalum]|uniref:Tetraspanin-7-like n=1 Tax=Platysternon megacephalum TaxID=55544 RepID=A0A4D9ELW1_9SAUR|nr:tetraspanin-7-like [Platysternon megacephalum]
MIKHQQREMMAIAEEPGSDSQPSSLFLSSSTPTRARGHLLGETGAWCMPPPGLPTYMGTISKSTEGRPLNPQHQRRYNFKSLFVSVTFLHICTLGSKSSSCSYLTSYVDIYCSLLILTSYLFSSILPALLLPTLASIILLIPMAVCFAPVLPSPCPHYYFTDTFPTTEAQ